MFASPGSGDTAVQDLGSPAVCTPRGAPVLCPLLSCLLSEPLGTFPHSNLPPICLEATDTVPSLLMDKEGQLNGLKPKLLALYHLPEYSLHHTLLLFLSL